MTPEEFRKTCGPIALVTGASSGIGLAFAETPATAHMPRTGNLQPAAEAARLALDNLREGPSYIPHRYYREMFTALRNSPGVRLCQEWPGA